MASSELRKLIEKKPNTRRTKDSKPDSPLFERSSTPPKRNIIDFARDNDENSDTFVLGRRESPRHNDSSSPMRLTDLLGKSSKKLKSEAKSSGKLSPPHRTQKGRDDSRQKRALMALPDFNFHLRFISSKRVGSQFGNSHVPCLPTLFKQS